MRLLEPGMAIWLLTLPLAISLWLLHVRAKEAFRRQASIGATLAGLSRLSSGRRDALVLGATVAAIGGLVLATMRPQVFLELRVPQYERQDIVLILDRSASMGAQDILPSRFSRAIEEIRTFLAEKPEEIDRVALVGFAGTSLTLSHLTRDLGSLFFYFDWIRDDREVHFGTDIGAALEAARELTRKDGRETKKFFLVLSDGDDEGAKLATTLDALRGERTRVHCIGIGSDRETPIPIASDDGSDAYLQDEDGGLLMTRFDEGTLRRIALQTGGRYFRSTSGRELAAAMAEVVRHERRVVGWKTSAEYRDVHRLLLMLSAAATLVLLLVA